MHLSVSFVLFCVPCRQLVSCFVRCLILVVQESHRNGESLPMFYGFIVDIFMILSLLKMALRHIDRRMSLVGHDLECIFQVQSDLTSRPLRSLLLLELATRFVDVLNLTAYFLIF